MKFWGKCTWLARFSELHVLNYFVGEYVHVGELFGLAMNSSVDLKTDCGLFPENIVLQLCTHYRFKICRFLARTRLIYKATGGTYTGKL